MMPKFHKLIILFIFIFSIQEKVNAQAPSWIWANAMGGISADIGYSIVTDNSGNVYSTGLFSGTADFDPSAGTYNLITTGPGFEIFISKLNSAGNFVWAKRIGGSGGGSGSSIALDAFSNVYITGNFQGTVDFNPDAGVANLTAVANDMFIAKLDAAGNFVWAKQMGGIYDNYSLSITIDTSDNVYITGYFGGGFDFDPGAGFYGLSSSGGKDIFISKFNSSGDFIWAKSMGGANDETSYSIAIDELGNIYTTGVFLGTADFDPNIATFNLTPAGAYDVFISKLDSSGNFIWAKAIGGSLGGVGFDLTIDASNNVYTTGCFYETIDFDPGIGTFYLTADSILFSDIFISKLDALGNFVWAKALGGTSTDNAYSICLDTYNNVYTTGYFAGTCDFDSGVGTFDVTSSGEYDIFVSKLDSLGNFVWANGMGGIDSEHGNSIFVDVLSNVYITGDFVSPAISFSSDIITNADNSGSTYDVFIAKLDVFSGIESLNNNNFISLYPNPTTDIFTISFEKNIKKIELRILDITGKIIYTTTESNTQQIEVNTKDFSSGIYFVQITSSDFVETKKLVVAK